MHPSPTSPTAPGTTAPSTAAPTTSTAQGPGPVPVVLDLDGVQARYRIGRTKAIELCAMEAFPKSVVPGMHR
ncbi:MAG: hypothetical protein M0Z46_07785 [Actinomycetota bacterium]|jgi:hypothetical protein|nr:hypothetical protein [Actinomycetota bacterium]